MNEFACPACGSHEATHLGDMGAKRHYRCRQCGAVWSEENPLDANDIDWEDEDSWPL